MTYGQQIMRLQRVLMWMHWIDTKELRAGVEKLRITVTGNVSEVGKLKPYTGYEALHRGSRANWPWYGPGGERE